MNRDQAIQLINEAIDQLVENDSELLDLDVSERALSYKLAHYMSLSESIIYPVVVDCEYNRHFAAPKKLILPKRRALDRELTATTVFPDIIVHERNSDKHNHLVIEIKKPGGDVGYDSLKLNAFIDELGYKNAAHLVLGVVGDNVTRDIIWIDRN